MKTFNSHKLSGYLLTAAVASATAMMAMSAQAYNLYAEDGAELNLDIEAVLGTFSSDENYFGKSGNGSTWQEGYIKAGFSGSKAISEKATIYGGLNFVSSGTWGDGDAGGNTDGSERRTAVEDAFIGYRTDMLDLSFGRQNFSIGDGFLINGDSLNLGEGVFPDSNRGGAYWLAARKAFDKTAIARIGGDDGWRGDLFYLHSDNKAQSEMELAGANVEYITDIGTFGGTYIKGLDAVNNTARDGQKTMSVRYQGNAGVENLFLSAEYADQSQGDNSDDANAWYAEAGWTFADVPWSPQVTYRYTKYDEGFDSLFYGFSRGYGTWFQGEVAANYAGPFGASATIQHVALKASPTEMLSVGALYFDFSDSTTFGANSEGQEIDLYAEWVVNEHLIISPLIGVYSPDNSNQTQNSSGDNVYAQVIAIVPF
ncbi:alginate export family protein [Amphritea sp. 1_MG-2023]|uniref:alginate export family protein n=1 Tax=Amphritea sp. 1_MG-2023 TaxID=3062670 RepID=UPI0026E36546|nr:alginate export family protein [Amphritea sp. 1_MG-2023]MDO6561867.1 alginate export family protein [Amphritea sp. 1_MG-2023]